MAQKTTTNKPSYKHIPEGILVELLYVFCIIAAALLISLVLAK
jgi:hypothetical protein